MKKQEEGITLIALIISIIILIILSAITINAAYNSGIIKIGTEGAKEYADATEEEKKIMNKVEENMKDITGTLKQIYLRGEAERAIEEREEGKTLKEVQKQG